MSLYDLIMGGTGFTKDDWAKLGRGEITDQDTVRLMLLDGYQGVANED